MTVDLRLRVTAHLDDDDVYAVAMLIERVAETDGVHYVPAAIGAGYPLGTLVVQNGDAPAPADESDINGYEYDGSTQFKFVSFADALQALLGN